MIFWNREIERERPSGTAAAISPTNKIQPSSSLVALPKALIPHYVVEEGKKCEVKGETKIYIE